MEISPKYPDVVLNLAGMNSNAFAVMAATARSLRRASVPDVEIDRFYHEAIAGDYDHLVLTMREWVSVSDSQTDE